LLSPFLPSFSLVADLSDGNKSGRYCAKVNICLCSWICGGTSPMMRIVRDGVSG
jgi:hypothetical protein